MISIKRVLITGTVVILSYHRRWALLVLLTLTVIVWAGAMLVKQSRDITHTRIAAYVCRPIQVLEVS